MVGGITVKVDDDDNNNERSINDLFVVIIPRDSIDNDEAIFIIVKYD